METFNFCPNSLVPEMLPREQSQIMSLGGWSFSSKPTVPFVKTYRLTLYGLYWFLDEYDRFNPAVTPEINARALELFYERHELWRPFLWTHPHIGSQAEYRFKNIVTVPKALPNSNGLVDALEVQLIEHNPGYTL